MPYSEESLPERIRRRSDELSASQRRIARYCVTEPRKAGTLTAFRIAEELRVSESTVVRFAVRMGYQGFPDMQAAIRSASSRVGPRAASDQYPRRSRTISRSLHHDVQLLQETIQAVDDDRLDQAAAALDTAHVVHVAGFRTAFSLAYLAEYHVRQVRSQVRLIGALGGTAQDDVAQIGPSDALLAFTFPVYDARTIQAIEAAAGLGATCVVVTDSALAPLPLGAHVHTIIARHEGLSFFNSNVAAVAVVNALLVRLVELRAEREPDFPRQLNERFQQERPRPHGRH